MGKTSALKKDSFFFFFNSRQIAIEPQREGHLISLDTELQWVFFNLLLKYS